MLSEISCDDQLLLPLPSQAAVFSKLDQEIIRFQLATRLGDYIRAYDTNVLISPKTEKTGNHGKQSGKFNMMGSVRIYQRIGMEIKRETAIYWIEKDMSTSTTYNRPHLLDSVDILIGPNMVGFLVIIVSSVVYKSV